MRPRFVDTHRREIFPIAIPRPSYPFRFERTLSEPHFNPLAGSRNVRLLRPCSSESVCLERWQHSEIQVGLSNLPGEPPPPLYRGLPGSGVLSAGQFLHSLSLAAGGEMASNLDRKVFQDDRISRSIANRHVRTSSDEQSGCHRLTAKDRHHARVVDSNDLSLMSQLTEASRPTRMSRSIKRRSTTDARDRIKLVPLDSVSHQKVIDLTLSSVWRPY